MLSKLLKYVVIGMLVLGQSKSICMEKTVEDYKKLYRERFDKIKKNNPKENFVKWAQILINKVPTKSLQAQALQELIKAEGIVIKIIEGDGDITEKNGVVKMTSAQAKLSKTVWNTIEDIGAEGDLQIPHLVADIFRKLLPLWNKLAKIQATAITEEEKTLQHKIEKLLQPTLQTNDEITAFKNTDFATLYKFIQQANFLSLEPILYALCSIFADKITILNDIKVVAQMEINQDVGKIIAHYLIKKHSDILNHLVSQPQSFESKKLKEFLIARGISDYVKPYKAYINDNGWFLLCYQENVSTGVKLQIWDGDKLKNSIELDVDFNLRKIHRGPFQCALSVDNNTAIFIGKRFVTNKEICLLKIYMETGNIEEYNKKELKDENLFVTFSADDTKICVVSGDYMYFYDKGNPNQEVYSIQTPGGTITNLFAHTYNNEPYVIIKYNENKYYMLNTNDIQSGWQEQKTLERFFDLDDAIRANGSRRDFVKMVTGLEQRSPQDNDFFNFYTYQMIAFVIISTRGSFELINAYLISIKDSLKKIIEGYNTQSIDLQDALYILAFKLNNWEKGDDTIAHSTPSIKNLFEKSSVSSPATEEKKRILIGYIKRGLATIGTFGLIRYFSKSFGSTRPLYLGIMAAFTTHQFFKSAGKTQFSDPSLQKRNELLQWIGYGLGATATLGAMWYSMRGN